MAYLSYKKSETHTSKHTNIFFLCVTQQRRKQSITNDSFKNMTYKPVHTSKLLYVILYVIYHRAGWYKTSRKFAKIIFLIKLLLLFHRFN